MSTKKGSPLTRAWHGALMLFGIAILLTLTISLLAKIFVWLLIAGATIALVAVLIQLRRRHDRW